MGNKIDILISLGAITRSFYLHPSSQLPLGRHFWSRVPGSSSVLTTGKTSVFRVKEGTGTGRLQQQLSPVPAGAAVDWGRHLAFGVPRVGRARGPRGAGNGRREGSQGHPGPFPRTSTFLQKNFEVSKGQKKKNLKTVQLLNLDS